MNINFRVTNQKLVRTSFEQIVENSINYLFCNFEFSEDWNECSKNAYFSQNGTIWYVSEVNDENICEIPIEVIKHTGFRMYLVARDVNNNMKITTNIINLNVELSGNGEGEKPSITDINSDTLNIERQGNIVKIEIKDDYTTDEELQNAINELETSINEKLTNYYTKSEVDGIKNNINEKINNEKQELTNTIESVNSTLNSRIDNLSSSQEKALENAINDVKNDTANTYTTKVEYNTHKIEFEDFVKNVNALLSSDDTTLDTLQEIVNYIKNNKDLLDGITVNKINYSDIVDNLETALTNKVLSANQGVVLKQLIDELKTTKLDKKEFEKFKINNTNELNTKADSSEVNTKIDEINSKIGNIESLTTDNKNTLVEAINEVNAKANNNANDINKLDLSLIDLKEALYGYVLDTAQVEIEEIIPKTINVNDTTYNLVDNVRGLVNSVNGNTAKSENLIVLSDVAETTTNGITYSIKNGVITLNGTATSNFNIYLSLKAIKKFNGGNLYWFNKTTKRIDFGLHTNIGYVGVSQMSTQTSEKVSKYGYITGGNLYLLNGYSYNENIKPMLVEGTTAPTEFKQGFDGLKSVEYEGLNIKGKNLLDLSSGDWNEQSALCSYDINTSTITAKTADVVIVTLKNPIKLTKGTYTFIRDHNGFNLSILDENDNIITFMNWSTRNITFTIDTDKYIQKVKFNSLAISFRVALEKGTISTSDYRKPYSTNILPFTTTLRGVGTAKDKIVISENENGLYTATKVSNVGEVDLGTQSWGYIDESKSFITTINNIKRIYNFNTKMNALCSKYNITDSKYSGSPTTIIGVSKVLDTSGNNYRIIVYDSNYESSTSTDFKTAMDGVMFAYELETPITEVLSTTLTESDVMAILELGGSIDIINSNSNYVKGSTTMEMVYKLINTTTTSEVSINE